LRPSKPRIPIRDITVLAMMSTILIISKEVRNFLPGIEPVSLLIIVYTLVFGYRTLYIIYTFVLVEGFIFGMGTWWFFYLYVWTILFLIARIFRKVRDPFFWAMISGFFGLSFGVFYSFTIIAISGLNAGIVSWINGIYFDIIHGVFNFILALLLFKPLYYIVSKLNNQ
ncbi:MAG: hypothetical protein QM644_06830, partial [Mobilitalea sp.]